MKKLFWGIVVAALVAGSAADASAQCWRGWGCGWGRRAVVWRSTACGGYSSRLGAVETAATCSGGSCRIESAPAPETSATCSGGACSPELPPAPDTSACVGGVCEIGAAKTPVALATPEGLEAEILAIANAERADRKLPPLQFDDAQSAGARRVARRNACEGRANHYLPLDFYGGEICTPGATARQAVDMWIGSPGHYAHLFSGGYNRVSIGVAEGRDRWGRSVRFWTFRLFYRAEGRTK